MSWWGEDEKITTQAEGCDSTQNEGKTQMEEDQWKTTLSCHWLVGVKEGEEIHGRASVTRIQECDIFLNSMKSVGMQPSLEQQEILVVSSKIGTVQSSFTHLLVQI